MKRHADSTRPQASVDDSANQRRTGSELLDESVLRTGTGRVGLREGERVSVFSRPQTAAPFRIRMTSSTGLRHVLSVLAIGKS